MRGIILLIARAGGAVKAISARVDLVVVVADPFHLLRATRCGHIKTVTRLPQHALVVVVPSISSDTTVVQSGLMSSVGLGPSTRALTMNPNQVGQHTYVQIPVGPSFTLMQRPQTRALYSTRP